MITIGVRRTEGGAWVVDEETLLDILSQEEGEVVTLGDYRNRSEDELQRDRHLEILEEGTIEDSRF